MLENKEAGNQSVQCADICLFSSTSIWKTDLQAPVSKLVPGGLSPGSKRTLFSVFGCGRRPEVQVTPEKYLNIEHSGNLIQTFFFPPTVFCRECLSSALSKWLLSQWEAMFSPNGAKGLAGSWLCLLWCWYQAIWHICFLPWKAP